MSLNDATPSGNIQLDNLFALMRAPVPEQEAERTKAFGAVRKSMSELQSTLNTLNPVQVRRLHAAIAEYETRTKAMLTEIHADLGELRKQVTKVHPTVTAATATATSPATVQAKQPMTLQEYENNMFPNPAQRTGIAWGLRHLGYGLHRMAFAIGKLFNHRPAGATPPPADMNTANNAGTNTTNTATATTIETLPPVRGEAQNLLQFANRGPLQLGDQRLSIVRTGSGPNEKYLFDIGTKRYELIIEDYEFENGPVVPINVSRELLANESMATTALRFKNDNVVLVGEAKILTRKIGGQTQIPKAEFLRMIQTITTQQAADKMIEFKNVSVRYSGMIQTNSGHPLNPITKFRGPVDTQRTIPKITFVEVPRV